MTTYTAILVAAPMLAACIVDVRRRIIPDISVMAIAAIGVATALLSGAPAWPLAAGGICAVGGLIAVYFGAWGWGDAKLLAATGLAAPPEALPMLLLSTTLAGGAIAGMLLLLRRPLLAGVLVLPAGAPRWLRAEATRLRRAPSVPYAIAIAAGFAAAVSIGA